MARPVGWAAQQPTCKHGHPYPQHLTFNTKGAPYCRECQRLRNRRYRLRTQVPALPSEPDPVAIQRAVAGDPPERLTPRERWAAVLKLTAREVSARQIAEQLGCSQRTVHRARSRTTTAA